MWEQERMRCPVHRGPLDECPDDQRDWFPQRRICWPSAQLAAANRLYDLLHEEKPFHDGTWKVWVKEPSKDFPFHYRDGVTVYLDTEDANPGDDFTTNETASPKG